MRGPGLINFCDEGRQVFFSFISAALDKLVYETFCWFPFDFFPSIFISIKVLPKHSSTIQTGILPVRLAKSIAGHTAYDLAKVSSICSFRDKLIKNRQHIATVFIIGW